MNRQEILARACRALVMLGAVAATLYLIALHAWEIFHA